MRPFVVPLLQRSAPPTKPWSKVRVRARVRVRVRVRLTLTLTLT